MVGDCPAPARGAVTADWIKNMTTFVSSIREQRFETSRRTVVPWLTVIPLAALLTYADGFWLISFRGAVGSIERTQEPFISWLRESTLTLPLFVFAVLGASMLALRLFGPGQRSRTVLATSLVIVAAGTLAGVVVLTASTAYDYHLQLSHLAMSGMMRGDCSGSCLVQQQHATFLVDVKAVGYGSALMLGTNLLLVGWLVALRGGRVLTSSAARGPAWLPGQRSRAQVDDAPVFGDREARGTRLADLRLLLAVGLVGSAVIHAAVVPEHLHEWPAAGTFFMALAAAEVVAAVTALDRPSRATIGLAALVSVGPLALWAYSRTLGMPFGPEPGVAEAVGLADVAACVLEVGSLLAAALLLVGRDRLLRPSVSADARRLAVVAVVAVAAIGLGGSELAMFDALGGPADHEMTMTPP